MSQLASRLQNWLKFLSLLVAVIIPMAGIDAHVEAQTITSIIKKSDANIDTSVIIDSDNYGQPKSVIVAPIFLPSSANIDYEEWYRGLFYYFSSDRFNFKDMPVHYIVDKNGNIYEGINGGPQKKVLVQSGPDNPVVILYLAERGDSDLSAQAQDDIERLLVTVANTHAINPDKFQFMGLKLKIDKSSKLVNLTSEEIFGSWVATFKKVQENVRARYQPTQKEYSIKVVSFTNPAGKYKIGTQIVAKLKLKNTSEYIIFSGDESELLFTKKGGGESGFFVNGQWATNSQAPILPSDSLLLPGEEKEFDLKFKVPFFFGNYSEDFVITNATGKVFTGSDIKVSLEVDRGDLKILEILTTETGTLNIRANPSSNATVVSKASPGQRYVWLERNSSGWYKIQYEFADNGSASEGWILGKYAKEI